MNTLWYKIRADLWLHKSRTFLAILSIATGVFCVGTLFGMIDLELNKMDAAHKQSLPSHISMILNTAAGKPTLKLVKDIAGVNDADSLTPLNVPYKLAGQSEWQIGTLIIRPETAGQIYDQTTLVTGQWPKDKQLAIERLSAIYTQLKVGDSVEVETETGKEKLLISGIVRHPFVKPPNFGGQVHFFASPDIAPTFNIKADTFRQLLVQIKPPYRLEQARAIAHDIRTALNKQHIGVLVTMLQNPDEHWGHPFFAGINDILKVMALASLALACVLTFNTVSAHIAQQTDQIGIMKSLGGSAWTITKLYLIETGIIALIAVALAMPLSCAAAYYSSCHMLGLFNIECDGFDFSPQAIYIMAASGLAAPLLAALVPVWRGATMNIRSAIASFGLGGDFSSSRFDQWLERISSYFLPTLYAAALGNLFRRKGRLLQTQIVLVIAGVLFLVLMSLIASVNLTLDNEMARSRYTVKLGFSRDQDQEEAVELAKSVAPTRTAELWQRFPIEIEKNNVALKQKGSLGAQLIALPSTTGLYKPYIEAGRWLKAGDAEKKVVVISADTAKLNGIKIGDSIKINLGNTGQDWQVIGLYRWLAGNNYVVEPVYTPQETTKKMLNKYDKAAFALLEAPVTTLKDEADYLRRLKQAYKDKNINLDVYTTFAKLEQRQYARNQLLPVLSTLFGLASLIASVGGIGLSGTLTINVLQRTREIGVLSAIGAPAKAINRLFLLEGLLHGVFAWATSIPLAYYAAEPIAQSLGKTLFGIRLDFAFDKMAIVYWLGIVITIAWFAAFIPSRKASKKTVKESLSF